MYQDITTLEADVLVSSDDSHLTMGGGVSYALLRAGGEAVENHASKFVPPAARSAPRVGEVIVTTSGQLLARYIFHCVTIDHDRGRGPNEHVIESATTRCIHLANVLEMTSIGFPALGTGVGGFPFKRGADVMVRALARCLEAETTVDRVTLALHARAGVTDADLNAFYEHALGLASLASQSGRLEGRIDALQGSLHRVASGRAAELDQIGTELHDARMNLLITPDAIEDIDRRAEDSGVVELGERAIEVAQETVGNAGVGDVPTILAALDTELEAWRTKCNAYVLLMMKLQNERATYDTANVPTSLESRIERLAETIRQSYAVVDDVKQRLAGYQRAASAP